MTDVAHPPLEGLAHRRPVYITANGRLCRLVVWSEADWATLPVAQRPKTVEHFGGLGWVGAVPVEVLN